MNSKFESKLKMLLSLRIYLNSNPAITATIPNFSEFLTSLDAAILQIQTNSEQHQYNTKGVTGNKKQLKESLISVTADASRKMQAYAKYGNDTVLLAETKLTESHLGELADLRLMDASKGIYNRINENLAKVTPYGLTEASQTDFMTAITAFGDAIPQPRQSQLGKKENTLLVNQGFDAADAAVENMDIAVEIVRLTQAIFYAGYKNARKIIEQGTGSLQVQGVITDVATGQALVGATVLFRLSGQTETILEKQTAAKGGFMIKSLSEGNYDVTVSKTGYKTQTISLDVTPDRLCNAEVALEKN